MVVPDAPCANGGLTPKPGQRSPTLAIRQPFLCWNIGGIPILLSNITVMVIQNLANGGRQNWRLMESDGTFQRNGKWSCNNPITVRNVDDAKPYNIQWAQWRKHMGYEKPTMGSKSPWFENAQFKPIDPVFSNNRFGTYRVDNIHQLAVNMLQLKKSWCIDTIINRVLKKCDTWNQSIVPALNGLLPYWYTISHCTLHRNPEFSQILDMLWLYLPCDAWFSPPTPYFPTNLSF